LLGMPRPSIYWLLIFVPLSIVAEVAGQPVVLFATTCVAIVPLAGLIGRATDDLSTRTGPRVGGLVNATFGNIPELIIGILLVAAGQFEVVKAALIGSIVGNLLLVLGASYLFGGLRHGEQRFDAPAARTHSSSLLLAVVGMMMPAVFVLISPQDTPVERGVVSGAVAVVLIVSYAAALLFTLGRVRSGIGIRTIEGVPPGWSLPTAVLVLLASAVAVGGESELLVRSLDPTLAALHLQPVFVGLFIVAIIGNVAEHASAVLFAVRDKIDVSIEISFNSSTQIAMFVAPLLVVISPLIGHPMTFVFTRLEVVAVALATLVVSVIAGDGRSNWLEGLQLLGVYAILLVSSVFLVEQPPV
jgi:Ca2+:H+ antiporter